MKKLIGRNLAVDEPEGEQTVQSPQKKGKPKTKQAQNQEQQQNNSKGGRGRLANAVQYEHENDSTDQQQFVNDNEFGNNKRKGKHPLTKAMNYNNGVSEEPVSNNIGGFNDQRPPSRVKKDNDAMELYRQTSGSEDEANQGRNDGQFLDDLNDGYQEGGVSPNVNAKVQSPGFTSNTPNHNSAEFSPRKTAKNKNLENVKNQNFNNGGRVQPKQQQGPANNLNKNMQNTDNGIDTNGD